MNVPLVSIIIPCYNAKDLVREAIQSALDQSYPLKEVIVIDDGSTDGSLSVIKKFGENIKWESGPNRGGGAARNRGLSLAKGEYIQFLDADDLLDPDKLERQLKVLLKNDADLVYSDWRLFQVGKPEIVLHYKVAFHIDPVMLALNKQCIATNSPLIKKEALLRIKGFREDLPCNQDRELFLNLACSGARFSYLPDILHTVRQRQGSVSYDEMSVRLVLHDLLLEIYDELNPTTIHDMQPSIPPVFVSDERDKPDGSSSVSMRQGQ